MGFEAGGRGRAALPLERDLREGEAVATFFYVLNYAIAFTSVFVLRRREPDVERPYRVWGYPWTTAIALAGSLAFLGGMVAGDTTHSLVALAVAAASYPVFLGYRRLRARHDSER